MAPKALFLLIGLAVCVALPCAAIAQASSDTTRAAAPAVGHVLLDNGATYDAVYVDPSMSMQSIQIRTVDGRTEYVGFNRVRQITAVDGTDWTHRVLMEGRKLGRGSIGDRHAEPRAGTWALGSDFRLLTYSGRVPHGTSQGSLHGGLYLSRGLEIEPTVSVVLAGYPALSLETSALLHAPGGRHGHVFVRGLQAEYSVTAGSMAQAWGFGLGWETYASRTGRGRVEVGYTSIRAGSDAGFGNYLTFRFSFNSLQNAR